jgi:hypothetical protein
MKILSPVNHFRLLADLDFSDYFSKPLTEIFYVIHEVSQVIFVITFAKEKRLTKIFS